jgi:hypothetical protein
MHEIAVIGLHCGGPGPNIKIEFRRRIGRRLVADAKAQLVDDAARNA